jgi:arylsulfatase A-like enzyme
LATLAGELYLRLALAWLLAALCLLFMTPQVGFMGGLFASGLYGLATLIVWAIAALPWCLLRRRQLSRPAASQGIVEALPAPTWSELAKACAVALLLGPLLALPAHPLCDALLPVDLGSREAVVDAIAFLAGMGLASLLALAWGKWRNSDHLAPWWMIGVQWVIAYAYTRTELSASLPGRDFIFDLFTLVLFLGLSSLAQRPSLPGLSAPHESPASRRLTRVAALTLAMCSVVVLLSISSQRRALSSVQLHSPGATRVLVLLRQQLDADGDGFSSSLGGPDCDDFNKEINPAALELVGNGIDDNCAGGDLPAYQSPYLQRRPAPPAGWKRKPIILVTVDALRADALSNPVGELGVVAPQLAAFAKQASHFTRAYSPAPFTDHALRSVFTGHYPMDYDSFKTFMGHEPMLHELLKQDGYTASAISQVFALTPYLLRGYDALDSSLAIQNQVFRGKTSDETTRLAIAEFERLSKTDEPFFLWVHYFDPHADYLPDADAPFVGDDVQSRYRQEVWQSDRALGRLLEHLDKAQYFDEGVLALISDHGELLGEQGREGHGFWVDEKVLRVPMILRAPGLNTGAFDVRVSTLDLMTTLLQLGTGRGSVGDGRSLLPIVEGQEREHRNVYARNVYTGRFLPPMLVRAAIAGRYKLVQNLLTQSEFLYDLSADTDEQENLIDKEAERAEQMRLLLGQRWDRSMNDRVAARKFQLLPGRQLSAQESLDFDRQRLEAECQQGASASCEQLQAPPFSGP